MTAIRICNDLRHQDGIETLPFSTAIGEWHLPDEDALTAFRDSSSCYDEIILNSILKLWGK